MDGLIKDGAFIKVRKVDIADELRIFGSRFFDKMKNVGEHLRRKSRLVTQNYADEGSATMATKAPIVQRFSKRLALRIAFSSPNMAPYTRDVT